MARFPVKTLIQNYVAAPAAELAYPEQHIAISNYGFYSHGQRIALAVPRTDGARPLFLSMRWFPTTDKTISAIAKRHLNLFHQVYPGAILLPRYDATRAETIDHYKLFPAVDQTDLVRAIEWFDYVDKTSRLLDQPENDQLLDPKDPAALPRLLTTTANNTLLDPMEDTHQSYEFVIDHYVAYPATYARHRDLFVKPRSASLYFTPSVRVAWHHDPTNRFYRLHQHPTRKMQDVLDLLAQTLPAAIPVPSLANDILPTLHKPEAHLRHIDTFNTRMALARIELNATKRAVAAYRSYLCNAAAMRAYCELNDLDINNFTADLAMPYNPYSLEDLVGLQNRHR